MMEALHVNALVFPKYILNPLYGDPSTAGRVRGPFAAAVQMGFGLYGCAVVSGLAAATWRRHSAKGIAGAVAVLCLFGTLLTEQRSVWLGATVATIAVLLITPKLRAWTLPVIVLGALAVLGAFAVIPDLSHNTASRFASSEPVWERLNMNVAAENMIKARPLFGFGWGRFKVASGPYFRESSSYPLVYTTVVHNVYLSFRAELGIIGLSLG